MVERTMGHTYTSIYLHVIWATKGRHAFITPELKSPLFAYMGGIFRNLETKVLAMDGVTDHVHAVIEIPPALAASDVIGIVKSNSSRWAEERGRFQWQEGFAAFSVSRSNLDRVVRYVRNQEAHHRKASLNEELDVLFEKHGLGRRR
jgi:putative transposase